MEKYKKLNQYYRDCCTDLENFSVFQDEFSLEQYYNFLEKVYDYALQIEDELASYTPYIKGTIELPTLNQRFIREESMKLVVEFLYSLSPKYVEGFYQGISDGTIQFTKKEELEDLEINDENYYRFYNCSSVVNGRYIMNVIIGEDIADAFLMVHEFAHYFNHRNCVVSNASWYLLTEGYSHFFEYLFFLFLERTNWKKEAQTYYETLLYSVLIHSLDYVPAFISFDIFMSYGRLDSRTIYEYCKDEEDFREYFSMVSSLIRSLEDSMQCKNKRVDSIFEDANYVFMIPFTETLLERYPFKKDEILRDYEALNENSFEYYVKHYSFEHDTYQKVFHMKRKEK